MRKANERERVILEKLKALNIDPTQTSATDPEAAASAQTNDNEN